MKRRSIIRVIRTSLVIYSVSGVRKKPLFGHFPPKTAPKGSLATPSSLHFGGKPICTGVRQADTLVCHFCLT